MWRTLVAMALATMLAACGTMPHRATLGGGYYQNDGPGVHPPENLASIPNAQPKLEPLDTAANMPYEVLGRRYVPFTHLAPYHERGIASWYGRAYQGLKTSSGEPYNMYAMTAANPILPIPSYARVTDLANGRSVVVLINDRGPYWPGRIIDLSYAAAYKLGFAAAGTARVEVDAIIPGRTLLAQRDPPPAAATPHAPGPSMRTGTRQAGSVGNMARTAAGKSMPAVAEPRGIYLQLGAFAVHANAEEFRVRVYRRLVWLAKVIYVVRSGGLFKVQLGPYALKTQARAAAARIRGALDFKPMFVFR